MAHQAPSKKFSRVDQAALAAEALEQKRQAQKAKRKTARRVAQQMAARAEEEPLYMLPIQREVMLENLDYRDYCEARDEAREQMRKAAIENEVQKHLKQMGIVYTGEDRFYSC